MGCPPLLGIHGRSGSCDDDDDADSYYVFDEDADWRHRDSLGTYNRGRLVV
jgi:hypothetical protein